MVISDDRDWRRDREVPRWEKECWSCWSIVFVFQKIKNHVFTDNIYEHCSVKQIIQNKATR